MATIAPRIQCKDGTSLSVQASRIHYCSRSDNDEGPHLTVEVGFIRDATDQPVTPPETWADYADGEFPSDVYGYVPVGLVEEFISSHGGLIA